MGKRSAKVENAEYGAFAARIIRAAGVRASLGDPEDLAILVTLQDYLDEAKYEAIRGLQSQGWSVRKIGAALGISGQAVHQFVARHQR